MISRKYRKYLRSRTWKAISLKALQRDNYTCQRCHVRGSRPNDPLQVHHISYRSFNTTGRDDLAALETLHKSCHEQAHGRRFDAAPRVHAASLCGHCGAPRWSAQTMFCTRCGMFLRDEARVSSA